MKFTSGVRTRSQRRADDLSRDANLRVAPGANVSAVQDAQEKRVKESVESVPRFEPGLSADSELDTEVERSTTEENLSALQPHRV